MATVSVRRSDGDYMTLDGTATESLKAGLRGPLLLPGDDGYDAVPLRMERHDRPTTSLGRPLCGSE